MIIARRAGGNTVNEHHDAAVTSARNSAVAIAQQIERRAASLLGQLHDREDVQPIAAQDIAEDVSLLLWNLARLQGLQDAANYARESADAEYTKNDATEDHLEFYRKARHQAIIDHLELDHHLPAEQMNDNPWVIHGRVHETEQAGPHLAAYAGQPGVLRDHLHYVHGVTVPAGVPLAENMDSLQVLHQRKHGIYDREAAERRDIALMRAVVEHETGVRND